MMPTGAVTADELYQKINALNMKRGEKLPIYSFYGGRSLYTGYVMDNNAIFRNTLIYMLNVHIDGYTETSKSLLNLDENPIFINFFHAFAYAQKCGILHKLMRQS